MCEVERDLELALFALARGQISIDEFEALVTAATERAVVLDTPRVHRAAGRLRRQTLASGRRIAAVAELKAAALPLLEGAAATLASIARALTRPG